jgi:hypothetical protein
LQPVVVAIDRAADGRLIGPGFLCTSRYHGPLHGRTGRRRQRHAQQGIPSKEADGGARRHEGSVMNSPRLFGWGGATLLFVSCRLWAR